jgi:hypothetical protein
LLCHMRGQIVQTKMLVPTSIGWTPRAWRPNSTTLWFGILFCPMFLMCTIVRNVTGVPILKIVESLSHRHSWTLVGKFRCLSRIVAHWQLRPPVHLPTTAVQLLPPPVPYEVCCSKCMLVPVQQFMRFALCVCLYQ